jgi:hypothetical protein
MGHGILANDDRIINNNTQRHDQTKQADHVDGAAAYIKHRERGHKRNWYANGYPQSNWPS